jgi:phenylalanyl-tRNA synthetase alpha chain
MHDTFYISELSLLRTHNTGSTAKMINTMQTTPFAAFTIGKVYRNDTDDSTHSHQFTQCDFVCVGDVSFANLK